MTLKDLMLKVGEGVCMLWLLVYLGVILEWCGGTVITIWTNFTKSWGWTLVTIYDV